MKAALQWISAHFYWMRLPSITITPIDIIQILILAWIIYKILAWIKTSHAWSLMKGLVVIGVFVALIYNIPCLVADEGACRDRGFCCPDLHFSDDDADVYHQSGAGTCDYGGDGHLSAGAEKSAGVTWKKADCDPPVHAEPAV